MIHYFSGTGNSFLVARQLADTTADTLSRIVPGTVPPLPEPEGRCGLVFPVYAWGAPMAVAEWLADFPENPDARTPYIYIVLTCGDDIGRTDRLLRRLLHRKGWDVPAVFSVRMRNTYVCLPGFDVDPLPVVREKEEEAERLLESVGGRIVCRERTGAADVVPGACPWLKTYVLRPLFNLLLVSDRRFRVNRQTCIRCGRCAAECPLDNIRPAADGTPEWRGVCTHCLRCYHGCPVRAIDYGAFTCGKGQVALKR